MNELQEGLALPDKIDAAVKYIQMLQVELEKHKEKKEKLMSGKRKHSWITNDVKSTSTKASPYLEIQEMGPDLDIVLVNGLHDSFTSFNEIMHVLHQQGVEVVQASFSNTGNSVFHILHPKVGLSDLNISCAYYIYYCDELITYKLILTCYQWTEF